MRSVVASMATIRPNRPTGAAVALAVLLGVVALATVVGLTAAGVQTGESGLTTRPWTAEQMVGGWAKLGFVVKETGTDECVERDRAL